VRREIDQETGTVTGVTGASREGDSTDGTIGTAGAIAIAAEMTGVVVVVVEVDSAIEMRITRTRVGSTETEAASGVEITEVRT
jgi:urocanate hydratase